MIEEIKNGSTRKFTCADCGTKACEPADVTRMPSADVCLTRMSDPEQFKALYSDEDKEIALNAARTESQGYCRWTRLEETMAFAYRMGYHRIGIGFCVGLSEEARKLAQILRDNGFEVEAAACKCGSVPKSFIGITQEEQLHPDRDFEIMCNPAGQAEVLSAAGCDLCIILGLCVGHDTLFIRHCSVPVTVLTGKDRVMGHNPIAAIYQSDSYLKRVHSFIRDTFGEKEQ